MYGFIITTQLNEMSYMPWNDDDDDNDVYWCHHHTVKLIWKTNQIQQYYVATTCTWTACLPRYGVQITSTIYRHGRMWKLPWSVHYTDTHCI